MKYLLLTICFAAGVVLAADKPVVIKFKDNSELEGVVTTSLNDSQGFTLKTKYGESRHTWNQIDVNHLRQSNPELYKFYVQQSHSAPSTAGTVKIKLRNGTIVEGAVSTSPTDTQGFTLRSQYGGTRYEWNQIDLVHLSQTKPDLYQFYLQQVHIDDIKTDDQVVLFLRGKFVFRSEANSQIKNYAAVLEQINAAIRIQKVAQRNQQLNTVATNNRPLLLLLSQRCDQLTAVAKNKNILAVLISYRQAFDSLARAEFSRFGFNYTFGQEALANMR